MSQKPVTVIDYGAGNLLSVVRALRHIGAKVEVTERAEVISNATRLILPGVGAFADCMGALKMRGLITPIQDYVHANKLFFGICVGMQVMLDVGEEFGEHAGLGLIAGRVTRIPAAVSRKIPHVGWNALQAAGGGHAWDKTMLAGTPLLTPVYFVHSYRAIPENPSDMLAKTVVDDLSICAAIRRGNIMGCQFHPEKSGEAGLRILKTFMDLEIASQE